MKIQAAYGEFKRNRAIEVQSLLMKYKNRFKDLENKHRVELAKYELVAKNEDGKSKYLYIIYSLDKKINSLRNDLKNKKK